MRVHNFNNSQKIGERGEEIIQCFLESFGGIDHYEDVSKDKTFQKKDIDGLLWLKRGGKVPVEIKTDTYTTGNIFYETQSCVEFNTPGCMEKTEAKYLYYYFPNFKFMYCISMNEYRDWFHQNKSQFKYKTFENEKKYGNGTYHSGGYLIPMSYMEKHFDKAHWKRFDMSHVSFS